MKQFDKRIRKLEKLERSAQNSAAHSCDAADLSPMERYLRMLNQTENHSAAHRQDKPVRKLTPEEAYRAMCGEEA